MIDKDITSVSPTVGDKIACVTFKRNEEMFAAYEALMRAVPKRWEDRGRLKFCFQPIDPDYGDPLAGGFMSVTWGEK